MEDLKFKKIINELKGQVLTSREKMSLKADFLAQLNVRSPYWSWSSLFVMRRVQMVITTAVIVAFLGTTVTFASVNSLPGDLFYPVKIKVLEPVARAFVADEPITQAHFEIELVDERLVEAEKMDNKKPLDSEQKTEVKKAVIMQTAKVDSVVGQKKEEKKESTKSLDKVLNKHKDIIKKVNKKSPVSI